MCSNDEKNLLLDDSQLNVFNIKFLNSIIKGGRNIFLLWLISQKKIHGYGILSTMNEAFLESGKPMVHSSVIYPLLHSLEKDGYIESSEEFNGNHKVKMYSITDEGILLLNSMKVEIKKRPSSDVIISFIDDLIFNDKVFTKEGGE